VKALVSGAVVAAVVGALSGGAMQPQLFEGDRPSGPQMFAGWDGTRSTGPFDPGTTFASYHGAPPDYVIGTDWKKAMAWPDERAAVSAPSAADVQVAERDDTTVPEEPAALTRAAYDDEAAPTHDYPSLGGAPQPLGPATDDADAPAPAPLG
jgi:hypothetical protein